MNELSPNYLKYRWLPFVIILGVSLRLIVAARGHNYDLDSYILVAEIARRGANIYAETTRYNYGPVWFNILTIISYISSVFTNQAVIFRYLLTGFLSLVDIGIFYVLWKRAGKAAACSFFLNPISIIITGYHSQFDNLALFLGLLAVIVIGNDTTSPLNLRKLAGLLVLGFSLMTKHILFAFPLWLAVKQKKLGNKIAFAIIPIMVFLLGFAPYWSTGRQGIIQNVFMYKSLDQQYFFRLFIPGIISHILNATQIWYILLASFALVFRQQDTWASLLLYTCVLVAASPSIANQYLAIVIPFIAVYPNSFFYLYTVIGTLHLLVDPAGLHISTLRSLITISPDTYSVLLISLLCFGFVWHNWSKDVITLLKKVWQEVKTLAGNE